MPDNSHCAVCTEPGTLRCSRCRSIKFCGPEHQALLWSSHKLLCKPNAMLDLRERPLEDSEFKQYASSELFLSAFRDRARGESHANLSDEQIVTLAARYLPDDNNSVVADCGTAILLVPAANANFPSPPHAAFAYAHKILSESPPPGSEEEASGKLRVWTFRSLNPQPRHAIELQALVLGALIEKDAPQDLMELAADRLDEMAEASGMTGMGERARSFLEWVKETRAGGWATTDGARPYGGVADAGLR